MSKRLLIVEDDASVAKQLQWALADDYDVSTASTVSEALDALRDERPHVVTLDMSLTARAGESEEGLEILRAIRDVSPDSKVVMVTASEHADHAVRAIQLGAFDYYTKPIELEEFKVVLERAMNVQEIESKAADVPEELAGIERFQSMIGSCGRMKQVFAEIRRVAVTDVGVLIAGEGGTGKKLVAHAIHQLSTRRSRPLLIVMCGRERAAAEVLGLETADPEGPRRVFSGALERAAGGTVILDEIDRLSSEGQRGLLAWIESGLATRVGGDEPYRADARVIATTKFDLEQLAGAGDFLEALYYRLGVVRIDLPPLRARGGDVVLLASDLLARSAREQGRKTGGFTQAALRALAGHRWPGNIPELQNRVRRAVVMSRGRTIGAADLGLDDVLDERPETLGEARHALERSMVADALRKSAGNVTRAAEAIGVSRPTMYDLIKKYEIDVAEFKAD